MERKSGSFYNVLDELRCVKVERTRKTVFYQGYMQRGKRIRNRYNRKKDSRSNKGIETRTD